MNRPTHAVIALAALAAYGCTGNLASNRTGSEATPALLEGINDLEGAVEQNRRNRIAIFEGNALASTVFEEAVNAEIRNLGLGGLRYVDFPMNLDLPAAGALQGVDGLVAPADPATPFGVPASAACPFAMPSPAVDISSLSCRFVVSNAENRARVRATQALLASPLRAAYADEAPDPAEVRAWYAEALSFAVDASTTHALAALREAGACDQEPTVAESAFELGVRVGQTEIQGAVRTAEATTPDTQCATDPIVTRAIATLSPPTIANANELCPTFAPASADEATYLSASSREFEAGVASGIAEQAQRERARLVREWVCRIPIPTRPAGGGGGGGGSGDPLVLDLDGDGIHVSPLGLGAFFDYGHTGRVHTEWLSAGDAFLVLDRDGDESIQATELFGDVTVTEDGASAADGIDALALYDEAARGGNGDGRIDARDEVFEALSLWNDHDGDARTDEGELRGLSAAGIAAIDLRAHSFVAADGSEGTIADLWFNYR